MLCAHQRLLFQHIHKFLLCKDVRPSKRSLFHLPQHVTLVYINTSPIHLSYSLDEVPLKFILLYFSNEPISLAHCSKRIKLYRLLKVEGSVVTYTVPPFQTTYIGERRRTFA